MAPRLTTFLGSCAGPLPFPCDSVKCAVFSPPYKLIDGYSDELMAGLGFNLARILQPGGIAFMNFGQLSDDFGRPFAARAALANDGLIAGQTIIWIKSMATNGVQRGHFQPIGGEKLLNYCFEYIFTFYKPPKPTLDRLSIGVPYTYPSNLTRGTRGKNGDVHCAGDVWSIESEDYPPQAWFIPYETKGKGDKKKHKYEYPAELPRRCFRLAGCKQGDTIFEPFLGSGQTAIVAKQMGMNSYGCEIDAEVLAAAIENYERA